MGSFRLSPEQVELLGQLTVPPGPTTRTMTVETPRWRYRLVSSEGRRKVISLGVAASMNEAKSQRDALYSQGFPRHIRILKNEVS